MAKKFEGRVALVTGGASGIGRVGAQIFAREGAKVIVSTDANIKGGEETVKLIKNAGGEATFIKCDVSRSAEVEAMIDNCVKIYGRLDYAFNNAGIGPDGKRVPFYNVADCPEEIWDRTLDVNLKGVFLCLKYEIRQMLKQKRGAIVNTASTGAMKAVPGFAAYDASKAGLLGLTRVAALECATSGIRINTICPGPTDRTLLVENLTSTIIKGKGEMAKDRSRIGTVYYNRGVVHGIISVEAIRKAQEKYGKKPLTGEQVRWGLENLNIDAKRLKELGAVGFMQPLKVSCLDHEGGGAVRFQQWDGQRWVVITDWISSDQSIVRPMIEESAAKYAKEKGITPRDCSAAS